MGFPLDLIFLWFTTLKARHKSHTFQYARLMPMMLGVQKGAKEMKTLLVRTTSRT